MRDMRGPIPRILQLLRSPAWIVLAALVVRVLFILASGCYRLSPANWFAFEMADIGNLLATGHGFRLRLDAGPSAWTAPIYPGVVALTFLVFGALTHAAALALLIFNSIFAALTCWTIYRIAQRMMSETVAVWAAWLWALMPSSVYFSAYWIWETTLSTFLLSLLLLITLRMDGTSRILPWSGYGLAWGIAALTNPALLAWLPFSGCWLVYRLYRQGRRWLLPAVAASAIFWICLTPWLVRNYLAFGEPLMIRSGFGSNLRAGNNPEAQGWWVISYTYNNPILLEQYKSMGEVAYVAEQGRLARKWISENPGRFLALSVRRFAFFWFGFPHQGIGRLLNLCYAAYFACIVGGLALAAKRRMQGLFPLATMIAVYPLTYYITFPQPRYRHPIEPEILILVTFAVCAAVRQRSGDVKKNAFVAEGVSR
jgi:hypothetical protein